MAWLTLRQAAAFADERKWPATFEQWSGLPGQNPIAVAVSEMHRKRRWLALGLCALAVGMTSITACILLFDYVGGQGRAYSTAFFMSSFVSFGVVGMSAIGFMRPFMPTRQGSVDQASSFVRAVGRFCRTTQTDILNPALRDRERVMRMMDEFLCILGARIAADDAINPRLTDLGLRGLLDSQRLEADKELRSFINDFYKLRFLEERTDPESYVARARQLLISSGRPTEVAIEAGVDVAVDVRAREN